MPRGNRFSSAHAFAGNDRPSANWELGPNDHPRSDLPDCQPPAIASGTDHPVDQTTHRRRRGSVTPAEAIAHRCFSALVCPFLNRNRSVIPTGAKRSGGTCCSSSAISNLNGSVTLPFVIPSEAEGSAVQRTPH